jgi:hypothetical protein
MNPLPFPPLLLATGSLLPLPLNVIFIS